MNASNRFNAILRLMSVLALGISVFFSTGCNKTEELPTAQDILNQVLAGVDQNQLATDLAIIDDSLAVWGLTEEIEIGPQGVRYLVESQGTGEKPALENIIRINYSGSLLSNGETFDSGQEVNFQLFNLIAGFQTALPQIPAGSTVTLYIPSGLGYGPTESTDRDGNVIIPANANLIFEIELLEVI